MSASQTTLFGHLATNARGSPFMGETNAESKDAGTRRGNMTAPTQTGKVETDATIFEKSGSWSERKIAVSAGGVQAMTKSCHVKDGKGSPNKIALLVVDVVFASLLVVVVDPPTIKEMVQR